MTKKKTWRDLVIGAYYGCEISVVNKDGGYAPDGNYHWWNGTSWVAGRLPVHLWKGHKECRRRYRYALHVRND